MLCSAEAAELPLIENMQKARFGSRQRRARNSHSAGRALAIARSRQRAPSRASPTRRKARDIPRRLALGLRDEACAGRQSTCPGANVAGGSAICRVSILGRARKPGRSRPGRNPADPAETAAVGPARALNRSEKNSILFSGSIEFPV